MPQAQLAETHIIQAGADLTSGLNQYKNYDESEELLGELLFFLRQNKLMSTLMLCRQIEKIIVTKDIAELVSNKSDISDLVKVEKHKLELDKFFVGKGLGFKVKEMVKNKTSVDVLREFFGDKLIVE